MAKDNNNNLNSNNASEAPAAAQPPIYLTSSSSGREVDNVTQEQNDVQFTPLQEHLKYADMAYKAMSKWKKNTFTLPKGKSGKDFISEMTKLIEEWNSNSPRKGFVLKLLMIMPNLHLQQTTFKAKVKTNKETLDRRMNLWKENKIEESSLANVKSSRAD